MQRYLFSKDIISKQPLSCISIPYCAWFWQLWLVRPVKVKFVDQTEEDLVVPLKESGEEEQRWINQNLYKRGGFVEIFNQ